MRRFMRRWKVQRLFAWLGNFRRLVVRYERHSWNYLGFVHLGCILILLKRCLGDNFITQPQPQPMQRRGYAGMQGTERWIDGRVFLGLPPTPFRATRNAYLDRGLLRFCCVQAVVDQLMILTPSLGVHVIPAGANREHKATLQDKAPFTGNLERVIDCSRVRFMANP